MSHRDVDERVAFVTAQNNSNRMLAKNEMEIKENITAASQ
jgi:hypothetical protein